MKLFISHFETSTFSELLKQYENIDFSLFVDQRPAAQSDLSSINIFVLQEPNEYFGHHEWVIQNKQLFSVILTWDDWVLNNCETALFFPMAASWLSSKLHDKKREKIFQISHLCGKLFKTYGHHIRHEIYNRSNEIKIPKNFHYTYGDRYNISEAISGKEFIFGNSQFGIAVENTSHNGYFNEKIGDLMLLRTIPVYWGCSNIGEFYNEKGIITVKNTDDLIKKVNMITPEYYDSVKDVIEENFNIAKTYEHYEKRICDKITEIFSINKI